MASNSKKRRGGSTRSTKSLSTPSKRQAKDSPPNYEQLAHNLQVHQVELEMQNQALREAQAELEVSRNRYVNLYDFAPVGYATLSPKGVIQDVNLTLASLLQMDRQELAGKPFAALVELQDKEIFFRALAHANQVDARQIAELRILTRHDGERAVQLILERRAGPESFCEFSLAVIDVTERTLARQEARESQESLHDALEAARMVAWSWDLRSNEVKQSSNSAVVLGAPAGVPFRLHREARMEIHPEDQGEYDRTVDAAIRDLSSFAVQYRLNSQVTGMMEWFEEHGRVIPGSDGRAAVVRGVLFNVTERKRAEEAFVENYRRLQSLVIASLDPVALIKVDGRIECISEVGARLLGYTSEELTGVNVEKISHPDDFRRMVEPQKELYRSGWTANAMLRVQEKEKSWRWVDVDVSIMLPNTREAGFFAKFRIIDLESTRV